MIDAILFEPVLTMTAALGAAAIFAPLLVKPGRIKLVCACVVLAPISPFLFLAWLGGRLIALSNAVEVRWPGAGWAARVITHVDRSPGAEIIPFKPNRTRKGGKPA
jgi:hypothetical protein